MAGLGIQTRGTGIARIQKKGGGIAQRGMGAAFKKGGPKLEVLAGTLTTKFIFSSF